MRVGLIDVDGHNLCQFLIGKVKLEVNAIDVNAYKPECQFLIGKVKPFGIVKELKIPRKQMCQFLIGKVKLGKKQRSG